MDTSAEAARAAGSGADPRETFAEHLIGAMTATMETFAVHLGTELGLYQALHDLGTATAADVGRRAGVASRYAREWLEQQAAAGVVRAEGTDGEDRRFHLPAEHAEVLIDGDSPFYVSAGALMLAGVARVLDRLPAAYRAGTGVPYADYGAEIRRGIAALNRPMFLHELDGWLHAVPEVSERLSAGPPARVLDLGCGIGTSSIAIARAYPLVEVVGVDLDDASVVAGRAAADAAGVADRVSFRIGNAAAVAGPDGSYDVVTIFEALHDMGDPAGALRTARRLLTAGGSVLIADERVQEEFTPPGDLIERFNYGWSILHCLPATLAEDAVEANGTVLRPATVRRWAGEAGFAHCETLDIDNPFWRFYRLGG
jgi:ubiquinone/menaquinone biosynthesis C-methylase UbiE